MDENLVVGKLTRTRAVLPKYLSRMLLSLNLPQGEYYLQFKTGFDGSNHPAFNMRTGIKSATAKGNPSSTVPVTIAGKSNLIK